jgi:hypothetical protein
MMLAPDQMSDTTAGVTVAKAPEDLHRISDHGCGGVVWHRQPLVGFQSWIDAVDPDNLPSGRLLLRPDAVRDAMTMLCDAAQTPVGPQRMRLIDDIAALADIFGDVMQTHFLRLRLAKITRNACRKFHVDAITARLICTYRGPGTQYGVSHDATDPKRVFTTPTGSTIVLRGSRWLENPISGLLHRSPPIEGTGETRLVLVLDPVLDEGEVS